MDIIVGNTCVLLDRDPYAEERRKVYGRAGDYRTPEWGIEYRTLSNFWLKEYRLMSMVVGLCRQAASIWRYGFSEDYINIINRKDIEEAINTNNYELAMENFLKIKSVIMKQSYSDYCSKSLPLHPDHIENFEYFVSKGIDYWFKEDPFTHWITMKEGHNMGFEKFLITIVKMNRIAKQIRIEKAMSRKISKQILV